MTDQNRKSKIQNPKSVDPNLAERLRELAGLANQAGAQGVWLIRGASNARLLYEPAARIQPPDLPGVQASMSLSLHLNLADAGVLVVIRFPASDGGEPGIESRSG